MVLALTTTAVFAAVQNDLLVYASSLAAPDSNGFANGFVGKGTYKNGARVFLHAQAKYEQTCQKDIITKKGTKTITVDKKAVVNTNKEVDAYNPRLNKPGKNTGYLWNVAFDLSAETNNLCEADFTPVDDVTLAEDSGKVFLSNDGGVTEMVDTITGLPIEVGLNP